MNKTTTKSKGIKMRKILILGGSAQQIIAIETAKRLGLYTILCDFLPDNPGQYHADKFYLESTTDKEAILRVAGDEHIDGILAYASDPAAPTAAYVAEKLNLPGSPYQSVEILCNKDLFRAFLAENGFFTPKAKSYLDIINAYNDIKRDFFKFPLMIKPVDSSGSKGVSKINNASEALEKLNYAMSFSRGMRVIVEEYVEKYGYQIAGDGLSVDGKLVFRYFANDHFDKNSVNPFVPIAASFPYNMPSEIQDKVHDEIQRLLNLLHMGTATYNFDVRIDKDFNVYLMEVAPRNGGNYIPDIIRYASGVDLVECSIKAAMGDKIDFNSFGQPGGFLAYYAVHSQVDGVLGQIRISPNVKKKNIIENHIIIFPGDSVKAFTGANTALGVLLMRFDDMDQMIYMIEHSEEWIEIVLKENVNYTINRRIY